MRTTFLRFFFVLCLSTGVFAGGKEINPSPLLVIEGLGNGYSAPTVTNDRIFVTGEQEEMGYLFAYDFKGTLIWKVKYGEEWSTSYRGSRASPTVIDSLVYTSSGMGDIGCFDIVKGQKRWSVNLVENCHGGYAMFGYSVPVLIDKDRLYCVPGGSDTNVACLNRFTGKIIWTAKGSGETPGYGAPLLFRYADRNILVTFSYMSMVGLDADKGELLWNYNEMFKGVSLCNQPLFSEGFLYVVEGEGNGAAKFEISGDGSHLRKIWSNLEFDTYFGGFVKTGNFLYGSSDKHRLYWSIDAGTGKPAGSLKFKIGSTVSAGQELILYNQNGQVGMVSIDNGKMTLNKTFIISKGTGEHFAHPVIAGNMLLIRHGDALLVYDYQQLSAN
ncbi:MAG: PQQ-binding-like beta-propeller repeat protein [Bacteroidetes bacterium]|nr:PQQ-binding-like beta-propeller repeat protein [Bacteroidota bacterium]